MGDVDVVFPVLLAALAAAGAVVRRWWLALVPLVVWPVVYLGMRDGWWLDGVGDGWVEAAVTVTVASVVLTFAAIALGRGVDAFVRGPRLPRSRRAVR